MEQAHVIKNYDQIKLRLEQLTKEYNKRSHDYYFAIGDLFNQELPKGYRSTEHVRDSVGRRRAVEVERLLEASGTDISIAHLQTIRATARKWAKDERIYAVSFYVYAHLNAHKELIRDGMTVKEALQLVSELQPPRPKPFQGFNRTRRLNLGLAQLRHVANKDDDTPLTQEDIEIIGEAYAVLDSYVERKGIKMWEDA